VRDGLVFGIWQFAVTSIALIAKSLVINPKSLMKKKN